MVPPVKEVCMKVTAIIQARMGSSRLPGKVLIDIAGKPMLEHIVERLKKSKRLDEIIIATSDLPEDKVLLEFAKERGYKISTGSVHDVLSRYLKVAREAKTDYVVRICADCPLIDPEVVDEVVKRHLGSKADYTCNFIDRTFPIGLDAEIMSIEILEKEASLAKEGHQREHVTIFIREHPEMFKMQNVEAKGILKRPDLRLTVDTMDDMKLIRRIYSELYNGKDIVNTKDVIKLFERDPELAKINARVRQKSEREVDERYFRK